MAGLKTGALDRRLTVLRSQDVDDGTATVAGEPASIGTFWASKVDVSDGERIRAAANGQEITSRFVVRRNSVTRTIDGKDRLLCEGIGYQVTGTKDAPGFHDGIEITAQAGGAA